MLQTLFGATIVNADGRVEPVRLIGEQHVHEDLGSIPSFADWARLITRRPGWCADTASTSRGREMRGTPI